MSAVGRRPIDGACSCGKSAEWPPRDLLAELIIEASTLFETDRCRAKRCIQRAAELIRGTQVPEGLSRIESPIVRGGLTPWQVRHVAAYVESNIGAKISAAELAALVHLSIGHFFRAFRASFGATPQAYIMRQRILRAEVLMASSKEPLASIALDCGLCDQAHFSRAFRRVVGVSPNVWRRQVWLGQEPTASPSLERRAVSGSRPDLQHEKPITPTQNT